MVLPAPEISSRLAAMLLVAGALTAPLQAADTVAPTGTAGHVVLIIVDGLRPDLISAELTPTLQRLIDEGASTLEARTVRPSITLPSITSMLTGVPPSSHLITWNDYRPERGFTAATTIFDVAHEAGLTTAFFSGKIKLRHAADPESVDSMTVRVLPDASVITLARHYLVESQPHLMVAHLPNVDRAGHAHGWASDRQRETLRATDRALASLIEVIDTGLVLGPVRLIVTADHGGTSHSHVEGLDLDRRVPWIVWGDGVAPSRLPPVTVTATAATALSSLGLNPPTAMDPGPLAAAHDRLFRR